MSAFRIKTTTLHTLCSAIFVAALCTFSATVNAQTLAYTINHTFAIDTKNGNPVNEIAIYSVGEGTDNLFFAPDIIAPSGVQSLSYTLPFSPISTLILGVNPDSAGSHIILFTNNTFSESTVGKKWSQIFSSPRHNAMITLLSNAHSGQQPAIDSLTSFLRGSEASAADFHSLNDFSILQFTVRSSIGNGVPEPGVTSLLAGCAVSCGLFAYRGRRRRNQ